MDDADLMAALDRTVPAITAALSLVEDWTPQTGATTHQQYALDLTADGPAVDALTSAGLGVLSEESGHHHPEREITVVMDPVDGSTNASRQVPWYATSLCAVDGDGPVAALVVNQATGERFAAVRGDGATLDDEPIEPAATERLRDAVVALSGWPPVNMGWRQFRALGAAALDICMVAAGRVDAYIDCSHDAHGPWDYLGGLLVCREAGAAMVDRHGRDLVTTEHLGRRTPIAAATPALLDEVLAARAAF